METIADLNRALSDRYRFERQIGSGGMATVYEAEDTRHGRRVAIKVMRPEIAAVLGVDRFLSEIRVTANLQHPNLVPLFDSGDAAGLLYYVMPLVEGETLRARLERERQLPVDEVVRIGASIAAALDYAHSHGVIHRDLKPENILLQAGEPVVTDFGIALAVSKAGGARITQTGLSLGTPQYMSPEQATGDRAIDSRTDIYSLGAVIYEMLVGEPPHSGGTVQAIIARVVTERPQDIRVFRPLVPDAVAAAVEKALEKVPADRWSTGREFRDALLGRSSTTSARPRSTPVSRTRWADRAIGAVVALTLVGLVAGITQSRRSSSSGAGAASPVRFAVRALGPSRPALVGAPIAVSRDGRTFVYVGQGVRRRQLYIRSLESSAVRPLEGTENALSPFFSPDGQWVAFFDFDKRALVKIRAAGGPVETIMSVRSFGRATWGRDGSIVYAVGGVLWSVPETGGTPKALLVPDTSLGEARLQNALLLDDGTILYSILPLNAGSSLRRLGITSIRRQAPVRIPLEVLLPLQLIDGHLVYARADGALMSVAFDPKGRGVNGSPAPMEKQVEVQGSAVMAALSAAGTLVYVPRRERELVWSDDAGKMRRAIPDARNYDLPRVSPNGSHLAVWIPGEGGRGDHYWIYDLATATLSQLNRDTSVYYGEWSPDGTAFHYQRSTDSSIATQAIDGSRPPTRLLADGEFHYYALHPDGKRIIYTVFPKGQGDGRLYVRSLVGDTVPRPLDGYSGGEWAYRFSPDGRWLAYVGTESGQDEVYVRAFPGPGPRIQISQSGGTEPVWAADGRAIYYRDGGGAVFNKATIRTSPTFGVLTRRALFEGDFFFEWDWASYDVSRRTGELLLTRFTGADSDLQVVLNLQSEIRR